VSPAAPVSVVLGVVVVGVDRVVGVVVGVVFVGIVSSGVESVWSPPPPPPQAASAAPEQRASSRQATSGTRRMAL
jgi:hypothetical protein